MRREQVDWVNKTREHVQQLIKETPPKGANFLLGVQHILKREEHWNQWKNEGCLSFVKKFPDTTVGKCADGTKPA